MDRLTLQEATQSAATQKPARPQRPIMAADAVSPAASQPCNQHNTTLQKPTNFA